MTLTSLDALSIAEGVASGRFSAREVVDAHLERVDSLDGALGSFVFVDPERAHAWAKSVDDRHARGETVGPLAGVPFGVKELESVAGWPETFASVLLRDAVATTTSTQTRRLMAAGAIPLGLTASPERGLAGVTVSALHGVCRNPWDLSRSPGGSSGGSAAAVAAGLVPFATGSDLGGSIRLPAALCGVLGFKGTYGRVPRGPAYLGNINMAHYGPLARTARDAARYLDAVCGADPRDPFSLPRPEVGFEEALQSLDLRGRRSALVLDNGICQCEPGVAAVVSAAFDDLVTAAGLDRVSVKVGFPADLEQALSLASDIYPDVETADAVNHALVDNLRSTKGLESVAETVARTLTLRTPDAQARHNRARWAIYEETARVFDEVDILAFPTTALTAYGAEGPVPTKVGGRELAGMAPGAYTLPFNLSGHPAVSVPAGFLDGLPVGIQLVARRHDDAVVLAGAAALERARPWPTTAPLEPPAGRS